MDFVLPTLALMGLKTLGVGEVIGNKNDSELYLIVVGTLILVLIIFILGFTCMTILAIYLSRGKLFGWISTFFIFINGLAVSLLLAVIGPEVLERWMNVCISWKGAILAVVIAACPGIGANIKRVSSVPWIKAR